MIRFRLLIVAFWLSIIIILQACAPAPRKPSPPVSPPATEKLNPEEILKVLQLEWLKFEDLKGIGDVTLYRKGRVYNFNMIFLLKSPHFLRLETLSFWGQPIYIALSKGSDIMLYSLLENKVRTIKPDDGDSFSWLNLNSSIEDIVRIFSGNISHIRDVESIKLLSSENNSSEIKLIINNKDNSVHLSLDGESNLIAKSIIKDEGGNTILEIEYKDRKNIKDFSFPHFINISLPSQNIKVEIRFKEIQTQTGIKAEDFILPL